MFKPVSTWIIFCTSLLAIECIAQSTRRWTSDLEVSNWCGFEPSMHACDTTKSSFKAGNLAWKQEIELTRYKLSNSRIWLTDHWPIKCNLSTKCDNQSLRDRNSQVEKEMPFIIKCLYPVFQITYNRRGSIWNFKRCGSLQIFSSWPFTLSGFWPETPLLSGMLCTTCLLSDKVCYHKVFLYKTFQSFKGTASYIKCLNIQTNTAMKYGCKVLFLMAITMNTCGMF